MSGAKFRQNILIKIKKLDKCIIIYSKAKKEVKNARRIIPKYPFYIF